MKTLSNINSSMAAKNVSDLETVGEMEWVVLCKAWSHKEGWMKSTKALEIYGLGVLVQVTTQQRNDDGSYSLAEALSFVPNAKLRRQKDKDGFYVGASIVSSGR